MATTRNCVTCGAPASGRFCGACGAPVDAACRSCGAPLAPGTRFCAECGAPVGATVQGLGAKAAPGPGLPRWAFPAAGALLLAVVLLLLIRGGNPQGPAAAAAQPGAAAPPDISNLSPRERFDRLYNRSMQAAEQGDTSTFATFAPMALMAYAALDSVDADGRYHAALLRLHSGDAAGAAALGDSILALAPGHLFGYVVGAAVGRSRGDSAAVRAAYAGFRQHFPAESAAGRREYGEHRFIIDETRRAAGVQ